MTTINAHAPVPALLTSLQRAGWGDLSGREWQGMRTTLHALASQLPHKSGQGWTTAEQVADAAGLSARWVRTRMHLLEELGVITWTRGGVVDGKPAPSYVRIVKTVLVALIRAARPMKAAAEAARRIATQKRIADLRHVKPGRYKRRSAHAELSASPSTPTGEGTHVPPSTSKEGQTAMRVYVQKLCEHGGESRRLANGKAACPMCRRVEEQRATQTTRRLDVQALAAADHDLFEQA